MPKFIVKWDNGKEEVVEQSDCKTVAQFVNTRFGSQGAGKVKVSLEGEAKKPATKK